MIKKISFRRLIDISRPRFWFYVFGTYMIGVVSVLTYPVNLNTLSVLIGILGLFFVFPANLLIYGINDIYDYETDVLNPKKGSYEELVVPDDRKPLALSIFAWTLPFMPVLFFVSLPTLIWILIFVFSGIFYSALPIRAKARPPLDAIFSSVLYISSGVVGYYVAGGEAFPWLGFFSGLLWAVAMQCYSAVPDIASDKKAGVRTTATYLGARGTIILCFVFYVLALMCAVPLLSWVAVIAGLPYVGMMVLSLYSLEKSSVYYRFFPIINSIVGALIFMYVLLDFFV